MELGKPQGGVDWQTVRAILLRVKPDWKPVNSSAPTPEDDANSRAHDLCDAILRVYPLAKCSHCQQERRVTNFYRCWDCKTYLCEDCIKSHFGPNHRPHPKLIEQYDAEIAGLKEQLDRYRRREAERDDCAITSELYE
jgi:hypothetical protein